MTSGASPGPQSVRRGSIARLASEVAGAAFGLVTGAVTARYLGPEAKGTLSTLTYLVALAAPLCAAGLGEATQAALGSARVSLARALQGVLAALVVTTAVGAVVMLGLVATQFGGEVPGLRVAVAAAAVSLPLITAVTVLGLLLDYAGQVVRVSVVRAAITAVTAGATLVFVPVLGKAITGAMFAIVVGWGLGLVLLLARARALQLPLVPRWDSALLRVTLPVGIPAALSSVLIVASTRVDLLFVRALAGRAEAGQYSVALTVAQLGTYPAVALAAAAAPSVAAGARRDAAELVVRLLRTSIVAGAAAAAGLALLLPIAIPVAFGRDFAPAVVPALVLLLGSVLWGAQWAACRAEAARGRSRILLYSFGTTLVAMMSLDLALIPRYGLVGAAVASVVASLSGLLVVVAGAGRRERITPSVVQMLPRPHDVSHLLKAALALGRREHPSRRNRRR